MAHRFGVRNGGRLVGPGQSRIVLRASYRFDLHTRALERLSNTCGEIRGPWGVAVHANGVDAQRYERAVDRLDRLLAHHADRTTDNVVWIVKDRAGPFPGHQCSI